MLLVCAGSGDIGLAVDAACALIAVEMRHGEQFGYRGEELLQLNAQRLQKLPQGQQKLQLSRQSYLEKVRGQVVRSAEKSGDLWNQVVGRALKGCFDFPSKWKAISKTWGAGECELPPVFSCFLRRCGSVTGMLPPAPAKAPVISDIGKVR